ncbi:hypothetical protein [Peptostreptococcus sp. D1]|uniref:hypothetical protein n=1 Tax=Peptostreptococcus sp. D1 TaxID=72304 RepID=UPI0008ED7EFA|nr:hypothetical protein [Peptostreptococcus sp. D1]SFE22844.1 hypothetical protein SAMN02910278_00334 [Peptostreptococcus sp. D1]
MQFTTKRLILRPWLESDDLGCSALWCCYFDGNDKSRRCQEKCGFKYHHTEENKICSLLNEVRIQHLIFVSIFFTIEYFSDFYCIIV